MKGISLFAGIGGFDLGFERSGIKMVAHAEIDKYASQVLAHRFHGVPNLGDVRNVTAENNGTVDLICGGFPCQDLSVAGKRAGLAGERSGMWHEFHRIIAELRPRWVVIENVPGLLSSNDGRDMGTILRALAELRYGYAYRVLDAQYFGVAQRRRRVFIVANSTDWHYPAQVLFEPESCERYPAPSRETGEGIAGCLTARAGKDGAGANGQIDKLTVAMALNSRNNRIDGESQTFAVDIVEQNTEVSTPDMISLRSNPVSPLITWQNTGHGYWQEYEQAQTIRTPDGGGSRHANLVGNNVPFIGVRRLTPTECERLQGFPDGWTDVNGMSDTQRYKQLGNAVCVNNAEWIGKRIMESDT